MSNQTRLINEKIKMKSVKRDYNTENNYNYYPDSNSKTYNDITETTPAGIAGNTPSEKIDNLTDKETIKDISINEETSSKTNTVSNETNRNNDIFKKTVDPIASMYPSYVRFYSLTPDDEKVSVVAGDKTFCENLKCNSPSEYMDMEPGIYDMCFYDGNNTLLCEYKLKAFNCAITTLIITKTNNEYNVLPLRCTSVDCFDNTSYIRFIQTVPHAPAMDIYIDGIAVILGIKFNEISVFIGLPSGIHNITVTAAATSVIYADKSFNFTSESVNDMFIVSDRTGYYGLSLLANNDSCF